MRALVKSFPILGSNKNSGIFVHTGVGYLLNRMKIETNEQVIPQIEEWITRKL